MGNTFYFTWEVRLMEAIQQHLGGVGTTLASLFSMFGEELLLIAILGFVYWCYDKRAGLFVGMNLVTVLTWNGLLKNIALRRRPYFDHEGIRCLRPVEADADIYDIAAQGWSFPSGHSSNATSAYGSLARVFRQKWIRICCVCVMALIGVSRVCLGVHYPTDVLVGWTLGLAAVFLLPLLQKAVRRKWVFYALLLLSALPGCFFSKTDDYFTGLGMMVGFFAANLFEERVVRFENTRAVLPSILRLVGGITLFLALNVGLKLPFSAAFLESGSALSRIVRVLRYAVMLFIEIGVYPMCFAPLERRFGKKHSHERA